MARDMGRHERARMHLKTHDQFTVGLPPTPERPVPVRSARGSLNIRLSEDERAILATAAGASRQSTGEYIRRAALQAAGVHAR